MTRHPRYKPIASDVLDALKANATRPQTATDIARHIHMTGGGAYWDEPKVNRSTLDKLLLELIFKEEIHARTRAGWDGLAPDLRGLGPTSNAYALPEPVAEWQKKAAEQVEQARLKKAERVAKDELARRYPKEFKELVASILGKDEAEASDHA